MKCKICGEKHYSRKQRNACQDERDSMVRRARVAYGNDELEIDGDAKLSRGTDGAWVQAWVWLDYWEK